MITKFLANENFPLTSYRLLKNWGWDIIHISEGAAGITDDEVMKKAIADNRVIITFDSDYGELVFKYGYKPLGVIYLRIQNFSPSYPAELLKNLIHDDALQIENQFTVVDENQIRQRKI